MSNWLPLANVKSLDWVVIVSLQIVFPNSLTNVPMKTFMVISFLCQFSSNPDVLLFRSWQIIAKMGLSLFPRFITVSTHVQHTCRFRFYRAAPRILWWRHSKAAVKTSARTTDSPQVGLKRDPLPSSHNSWQHLAPDAYFLRTLESHLPDPCPPLYWHLTSQCLTSSIPAK